MKEIIMKKHMIGLPLAALLAVTLASCATPTTGPAAPAASSSQAPAADAASATPLEDEPDDDGTAAFGDTYSWEDGLEVVVKDDGTYRKSESAFAEGSGPYRKYRITITNGTSEPFDASLVQVSLSSGGEDQGSVVDVVKKVGVRPETTLRPGKSVSYTEAFSVPDKNDVTLEIAPDFSHDSVLYVKEG